MSREGRPGPIASVDQAGSAALRANALRPRRNHTEHVSQFFPPLMRPAQASTRRSMRRGRFRGFALATLAAAIVALFGPSWASVAFAQARPGHGHGRGADAGADGGPTGGDGGADAGVPSGF